MFIEVDTLIGIYYETEKEDDYSIGARFSTIYYIYVVEEMLRNFFYKKEIQYLYRHQQIFCDYLGKMKKLYSSLLKKDEELKAFFDDDCFPINKCSESNTKSPMQNSDSCHLS